MSEYYYNKDYFKIINNEHKAYWLGFLYADGYVEPIYRKDKIKAFRLELSLQESDEDMLLLFKKDIETNVAIQQAYAFTADAVGKRRFSRNKSITEGDFAWICSRNYEGTE